MNSKDSEKFRIDTRTFPEIWGSLNTEYEQRELRHKLMLNKCCSTPQTVWNWANGKTKPQEPLVLDKIAKVISDFLSSISRSGDVKCYPQTLFPAR